MFNAEWLKHDDAIGVRHTLGGACAVSAVNDIDYRGRSHFMCGKLVSKVDRSGGRRCPDPNDPYITQRVCSALEMCRDVAGRAVIALLKQRSDDERVRRKRQETVIWEYRQASDDGDGSVSILLAIPDGAGGHS